MTNTNHNHSNATCPMDIERKSMIFERCADSSTNAHNYDYEYDKEMRENGKHGYEETEDIAANFEGNGGPRSVARQRQG